MRRQRLGSGNGTRTPGTRGGGGGQQPADPVSLQSHPYSGTLFSLLRFLSKACKPLILKLFLLPPSTWRGGQRRQVPLLRTKKSKINI